VGVIQLCKKRAWADQWRRAMRKEGGKNETQQQLRREREDRKQQGGTFLQHDAETIKKEKCKHVSAPPA